MRGRSNFTKDACRSLGLPIPAVVETLPIQSSLAEPKKAKMQEWSIASVPMPIFLKRDQIWKLGLLKPQLELVVDNQTLAAIANGVASVTNEFYRAPLDRIRQRLYLLYHRHFDYKGGFLDPIDWRPREYNTAADHVANCVLAHRIDYDTLRMEDLQASIPHCIGLQVFTDGGYVNGLGAAAAVFNVVSASNGMFHSSLMGVCGQYMSSAQSAFHAEVTALDLALDALSKAVGIS